MTELPELMELEDNQESPETKVLLENLVNQEQITPRRDHQDQKVMWVQPDHLVLLENLVILTV